jgi:hypothetical protein
MAGANPTTALGSGYVVKANSPRVQVRKAHGIWQVLIHKNGETWAEIVAELATEGMARTVRRHILVSPDGTTRRRRGE